MKKGEAVLCALIRTRLPQLIAPVFSSECCIPAVHDLALSSPPPTIASKLCNLIEGLHMVWQLGKGSAGCSDCFSVLLNSAFISSILVSHSQTGLTMYHYCSL